MQFALRDVRIRRTARVAIGDRPSETARAKKEMAARVFLVVELGGFGHREKRVGDDDVPEFFHFVRH